MNANERRYAGVTKRLSVFINIHLWLAVFFSCFSITSFALSQISITAERIEHTQADIKNLSLKLNLDKPTLDLQSSATFKPKSQADWLQLKLDCGLPQYQSKSVSGKAVVDCPQGLLASPRVKLPFALKINELSLTNTPHLNASLQVQKASFSDEAGLHAADKLDGLLIVDLQKSVTGWNWQTNIDWQSGELFWQPFYIANGGHQLLASGKLDEQLLSVDSAHLKLKDIAELDGSASFDLSNMRFDSLRLNVPNLNLKTAYPTFFKPLLEKTAFGHAEVEGSAALKFEINNAQAQSFELLLKDVDIADNNKKFALYKLNANIPWDYDLAKPVHLSYQSGELLNLPLGKTHIEAMVDRYAFTAPLIELPILDGMLALSNISAARAGGEWYWHLSAKLTPIAMEDFSTALNLPRMQGKASAEIPLVTYAAGKLTTDGSLVLNVFNGTATVTQLTMQSPLGIAPKLNADIALRNLDLGILTSTFSFGAIEGKLDGDIEDLELQNWKPIRFDAMVQSSPGRYPKKISQRAVENISALGGGGAAAAVQRSFLRFFKQFNYGKMGLSCRLRNDICEMGGVESTPSGYIIVKGSGIPAITVMGYNQSVGWSELLARIKRVTDGNTKAVIQ